MQIRLLGAVDIHDQGSRGLAGPRRKAILAYLALRPGEFRTVDRIVHTVWPDGPPRSVINTLQHHVAYLRRMLGSQDAIRWKPSGYILESYPDITDLMMARRLVDQAKRESAPRAAELLSAALDLWHGPGLSDLIAWDYFAREAEQLEEFRLSTTETLLEVRLQLGEHADLVPELEPLMSAHPFRERLRASHILALYRAGRQNDALASYRHMRALLHEELGIDPGPALRALEGSILRQDAALDIGLRSPPVGEAVVAAQVAAPAETAASVRAGPSRSASDATAAWRHPPAPVTTFVGRDAELGLLLATLNGPRRIVTVVGVGGAGKTRLALEAASRASPRFPDGIAFVDLANTDSPGVIRRVADAVGVLEENDDQLLASLQAVLGHRFLLLIFDNCERIIDACATLVEALVTACPRLRIIATSRQPLGTYGEARIPLLPLPPPPPLSAQPTPEELESLRTCPSVALLLDRATRVAPNFRLTFSNASQIAETCRRLDGIPLALELAAARLAILSPGELVDGLDDRFSLLSTGPRTSPARHRTLRAALTWSYELLDEAEQTAFRLFSVFLSRATLSQARELCFPNPHPRPFDVIVALVEKSLFIRSEQDGETRLGMHETVREYAQELLISTGEIDSARAVHASMIGRFVDDQAERFHGPHEESALAALREHQADLQAVLAWATGNDHPAGLRMTRALWWYWFRANRTTEGRKWIDALTPASAGAAPPDVAFALAAGGYLAWVEDDFDIAQVAAQRALASPHCPPWAAGVAHSVISRIAGDRRAFDEAITAADNGEAIFTTIGDEWGAVWCRRCHVAALLLSGRARLARTLAEECLRRFQALGDAWAVAGTVDLLAAIAHELGDHEQAIQLARDAVERHQAFGDTSGTRYAIQHLAEAAHGAGKQELAASSAAASLELSEQHGYRLGTLYALLLLGELRAAEGNRAVAIILTERAEGLARELDDRESQSLAARRLKEWRD